MKTNFFNNKRDNKSIKMVIDKRHEKIFESFIMALNDFENKGIEEILTNDVKLQQSDSPIETGIKEVIDFFNLIRNMVFDCSIDPNVSILPTGDLGEKNAFKMMMFDMKKKNLLFEFKIKLRGEKIAEIKVLNDDFFKNLLESLIYQMKNK